MTRSSRPRLPPALPTIEQAARDVLSSLVHPNVCGSDTVIFLIGSFACKLYCEHVYPYSPGYRFPNDVDMVVCTALAQEDVKQRLAAHSTRIHLVPSKTPGMTYRVLRYGSDSDHCGMAGAPAKLIKVDVLVAEENLRVPALLADRVLHLDGWPLPPLSFLFLLRLQGWSDHRQAELDHHREKAEIDVVDLCMHLVPHVLASTFEAGGTLWEEAQRYLPEEFLMLSRKRAQAFVAEYPWATDDWQKLGFPLSHRDMDERIAHPLNAGEDDSDSIDSHSSM